MYLRPDHQAKDPGTLLALIGAHPLGAWVHHGADGLVANHLPFVLDRSRGPQGTLIGHVARANPVWRSLSPERDSIVMFQGPQAYITPGWYPSKTEHGQVVPTWNYAVAHVHGKARAIHDRSWLLAMLDKLTAQQETTQPLPWRVADAPAEFIDKLLRAIVGIEIPIERIEGRIKASQDEAMQDRLGTVQGLMGQDDGAAQAMAALVRGAIDGR